MAIECKGGSKVRVVERDQTVKVTQSKDRVRVTQAGGSIGATDYEILDNKPQINSVTLQGNQSAEDIGISAIGNSSILDLFR